MRRRLAKFTLATLTFQPADRFIPYNSLFTLQIEEHTPLDDLNALTLQQGTNFHWR